MSLGIKGAAGLELDPLQRLTRTVAATTIEQSMKDTPLRKKVDS